MTTICEESEESRQHRKRGFLRQVKTLLEGFVGKSTVEVEFSKFESEFQKRTGLIFGDHLYNFKIEFRDEEWGLTPLFSKIKMLKHTIEVKYVNAAAILVLTPLPPQTPTRPSIDPHRLLASIGSFSSQTEVPTSSGASGAEDSEVRPSEAPTPLPRIRSIPNWVSENLEDLGAPEDQNRNDETFIVVRERTENPEDVPIIPTASEDDYAALSFEDPAPSPPLPRPRRIRDSDSEVLNLNLNLNLHNRIPTHSDDVASSRSIQLMTIPSASEDVMSGFNGGINHIENAENEPPLSGNLRSTGAFLFEDVRPKTREVFWSDVHMMFQEPYWPGMTMEFRQDNYRSYQNLLSYAVGRDEKDHKLLIDAKKLAIKWWQNRFRFLPQTLYLLRKLSDATPNGFKLADLDEKIMRIFPEIWLELWPSASGTLADFLLSCADLVELNVIMRCDANNPQMFKVNKVIELMKFHLINEKPLSMIYQFVSSTPQPKSKRSIHKFMCDDFPGWIDRYDNITGPDYIYQTCLQSYKMFTCDNEHVTARDHKTKVPVPMCFSHCVVYRTVEQK